MKRGTLSMLLRAVVALAHRIGAVRARALRVLGAALGAPDAPLVVDVAMTLEGWGPRLPVRVARYVPRRRR